MATAGKGVGAAAARTLVGKQPHTSVPEHRLGHGGDPTSGIAVMPHDRVTVPWAERGRTHGPTVGHPHITLLNRRH